MAEWKDFKDGDWICLKGTMGQAHKIRSMSPKGCTQMYCGAQREAKNYQLSPAGHTQCVECQEWYDKLDHRKAE